MNTEAQDPFVTEVSSRIGWDQQLAAAFDYASASAQNDKSIPRGLDVARRVLDRSGYASNLKDRIHDSCYRDISGASTRKAVTLRTVQQIATNLLWISELCSDCIRQFGYLDDQQRLCSDDFTGDLQQIIEAIGSIESALQQALKVKRDFDEAFGSTHQSHNLYFIPPGIDDQPDGIGHDKYGGHKKYATHGIPG